MVFLSLPTISKGRHLTNPPSTTEMELYHNIVPITKQVNINAKISFTIVQDVAVLAVPTVLSSKVASKTRKFAPFHGDYEQYEQHLRRCLNLISSTKPFGNSLKGALS